MRTLKSLLVLAAVFTSAAAVSQTDRPNTQSLDSLYAIWQDAARADSARANAYERYITKGFLESDPDSAFALADALLVFAEREQYPMAQAQGLALKGKSYAVREKYPEAMAQLEESLKLYEELGEKDRVTTPLQAIGLIYSTQGDYKRALTYLQRTLALCEALGDSARKAAVLTNIGNAYYFQGNYPEAINQYKRSLKLVEESGDHKGVSNALNNIGTIYGGLGDYAKALEYFQRDLKVREELGDKSGIAASLCNIGTVYTSQEKFDLALENLNRAADILEHSSDKRDLGTILLNMGTIYLNKDDPDRALEYYKRSLELSKASNDRYGIIFSRLVMGSAYNGQRNHKQAVAECRKALELSTESGMISAQKSACACLYEAYKALGDGNNALAFHEQMQQLQDSLNAKETAEKLQQMEFEKVMLEDSLKQQQERATMEAIHQREVDKKNRVRNLLIGGSVLFLVLAIGFYSRWRYAKRSKDTISKERDRSDNLLLNILPAEIAAELKEKGEAQARDFELVSILFTDFKDFTQASEKLTATDLVAEINTCFMAFDAIVGKYKIEKIKTIGDAYMCAGGLPVPSADSVKNTVLAGLEMQAFMQHRKVERDAAGLPAFEMRVGIHTGPVVAGIVGVKKFQYDIWGDTVNAANRMESSGEVGQVNISEATYELVKEEKEVRDGKEMPVFTFTPRGKVQAKGKGEMEMYFVR